MTKKTWLRTFTLLLSLVLLIGTTAACSGDPAEGSDVESTVESSEAATSSFEEEIIGGDDEESAEDSTDVTDDVSVEASGDESVVGNDATTSGNTDKTDTQKTTTTTKKSDKDDFAPVTDLKGRTITVAMYGTGAKVFTDSVDGIYADSAREITKKYNFKLKVVTVPIDELIATAETDAMSGTATWDLNMIEGYHAVPKQCKTGYYLCLSDYYNFNDGVWNGSVMEGVGEYEGKRWAFPIGLGECRGIFYNKNLVKAANLPDPWTYVDNNTWNWDTFKTFAKSLTKDTDSDGQPNQFGFAAELPFEEFILTNNAQVIDMSSGRGKFAMDSANAKEAMSFVMDLYDEQIIPTAEQIAEQAMQSSFHGMATGKVAMFPYTYSYGPWLMENGDMDWDEIGWVYFPKGPKATDYVSPNGTPTNMLMVQRYAKNPEEIVPVMADMMAFWSKNHKSAMTPAQIREKTCTMDMYVDFLTGRHKEMFLDLASKSECINIHSYTAAYSLIVTMDYEIRTKQYTVQAGLDAYKSAIQAAITDLENVETV